MSAERCESCQHEPGYHGPDGKGECDRQGCGCYGFWPSMRVKHCDNPACPGTECTDARRAAETTKGPR